MQIGLPYFFTRTTTQNSGDYPTITAEASPPPEGEATASSTESSGASQSVETNNCLIEDPINKRPGSNWWLQSVKSYEQKCKQSFKDVPAKNDTKKRSIEDYVPPEDRPIGENDDEETGFKCPLTCPRPKCPKPKCPSFKCPDLSDAIGPCICIIFVGSIIGLIIYGMVAAGSGGSSGSHGGGGGTRGGSGGRGGGGGGSCFPAGELLQLSDASAHVPIDQLQAGAMIHKGGLVTAVMKLAGQKDEDPLYRYNDSVFVTGSHLVEEGGSMVPVEESKLAVLAETTPDFVYNAISEDHKLVINGTTFADWEEWEDCEPTWALERKLLDRLNHGLVDPRAPTDIADDTAVGEGAFRVGTPILLANGTSVSIEQVQPGDHVYHADGNNAVFAVMQLYVPPETTTYVYKNLSVTEWTLVLDDEDGLWRHVKYAAGAIPTSQALRGSTSSDATWYQLWTTEHTVPVSKTLVLADYHAVDETDAIFAQEL